MEHNKIEVKNTEIFTKLQDKSFVEFQAERYNKRIGDLHYYDCDKCMNRGDIAFVKDNKLYTRLCDCMKVRRSNRLLVESGIAEQIKTKTFENYICEENWQKSIKEKCSAFVENPSNCLFLGGQTGAGKTHLCTAVCGKFIGQGKSLRYVLWRDIVTKLQANVFNDSNYTSITEDLKNIDVLYIDDMFKLIPSKLENRTKELEIAFKILNDREISNKITIISTEYTIKEIKSFDEAITGRIVKMSSKDYVIQISKKAERNYRLKDLEVI